MKKGFTLVELLIVMVIIGTLVTVALPKYQSALERGRALEGIRNAQYAAEYANAKHMACEAAGQSDCGYNNFSLPNTDQVKSRFFGAPGISSAGVVTVTRSDADWGYSITATISDDALSSITCNNTTSENVCEKLDLTGNLMERK